MIELRDIKQGWWSRILTNLWDRLYSDLCINCQTQIIDNNFSHSCNTGDDTHINGRYGVYLESALGHNAHLIFIRIP